MNWLKKLQDRLKAGKIDEAAYKSKLKEYLDDEMLTQEEYDEALAYEAEDAGGSSDEKIYTQDDADRMAVNVAQRKIRQAFRDAGIPLDVPNKKIIEHVVSLVKGDGDAAEGQLSKQELAQLKSDAEKGKTLSAKLQNLSLENAVLRGTSKLKPVNSVQVVRALRDYEDEIEFDENGMPDKSSLDLVLRRLAREEPNLFQKEQTTTDEDDQGEGEQQKSQTPGRVPGGSGKGDSAANLKAKQDEKVKEGLKLMGLDKKEA